MSIPLAARSVTVVLAAWLATACSWGGDASGDVQLPPASRSQAVTDHVMIISVDGLRPDALEAAPTIRRLMREGSYTLEARTVIPSSTLQSHASMLTGVEPNVHGIAWNSDEVADRGYIRVPTVFGLARAAGLRTAAFFGKSKLNHIHRPAPLGYTHAFGDSLTWQGSGDSTARLVAGHLARARPNLLFVHLVETDYAGHLFGWLSREYGQAVRDADAAVGALLAHADAHFGRDAYTVILTSDHGGHERTHGTDRAEDVTIPWIAWGRGARAGRRLPPGIRTTDTAATVLWLLGVAVPGDWTGRPVTQAFDAVAPAPSH